MANMVKKQEFSALEKIRAKKYALDLISSVLATVESRRQDVEMSYEKIGKSDKQSKHWKTGELIWEDEEKTIPKYDDLYDYVKKSELSRDDEIDLSVLDKFTDYLITFTEII